jgi:hypothetical protein
MVKVSLGLSRARWELVNMLKIFSLGKRVRNSQLKGLGYEIYLLCFTIISKFRPKIRDAAGF